LQGEGQGFESPSLHNQFTALTDRPNPTAPAAEWRNTGEDRLTLTLANDEAPPLLTEAAGFFVLHTVRACRCCPALAASALVGW